VNIALIGPSGAGKGTHAEKLVARYELLHLATGDLFRSSLEQRTALGILAERYMGNGELVPDELVDAMIEEALWKADPAQGVVFDGFPRTRYQAIFLDGLFQEMDRRLDAVIYLKVSDQAIISRLAGRMICRTCQTPYHVEFNPPARPGVCDVCGGELYHRADDALATASLRLKVFHRVTDPLVGYYQEGGRLIIIDGEGDIDRVHSAIIEVIEAVRRQESRSATRAETEQIQARKGTAVALSPAQTARPSLDLVLLGGPGSGKGTQAEQLTKRLNLPHIATGDLFRENLKHQTELGRLAKTYMDRGELVPDDVTESMVQERLARPDTADGFILDGFPRTLPQAEALTEMLTEMQRRLAGVLYINVSDEEIVRRLSGRLICRNCQTPYHLDFKPPAQPGRCDACGGELYQRDDDNPDTVRARLKTFHGQTAPLVDYYQAAGLLIEIDGEGDVAGVTERTLAAAHSLAESTGNR
jgi:adenylate kinase